MQGSESDDPDSPPELDTEEISLDTQVNIFISSYSVLGFFLHKI
jgi:hypothetical protein